jgi:hypothetical protein
MSSFLVYFADMEKKIVRDNRVPRSSGHLVCLALDFVTDGHHAPCVAVCSVSRGEAKPKLTMVHFSRNLHNFARLYGNFEHN